MDALLSHLEFPLQGRSQYAGTVTNDEFVGVERRISTDNLDIAERFVTIQRPGAIFLWLCQCRHDG